MPVFDPGVPWLRGTATLTNGSTTVTTDGIITLNEILEGDRLYVMDGGQRIGPLEIVGGEGDEIELREPFEGATGSYPIIIDRNPITPIGAKILRDVAVAMAWSEDYQSNLKFIEGSAQYSKDIRRLDINNSKPAGGGFPRSASSELKSIFTGGNPDEALPKVAATDLAECLILPPTEDSTNFVFPDVPWMTIGGAPRRVVPMDWRTILYNTPVSPPLFEPVITNGWGNLVVRYIGDEPIHTILRGSLSALIRVNSPEGGEDSYARHILRLRTLDAPDLEMGQNDGTRSLASTHAAHGNPSFIEDYWEFNDLCFPLTQDIIDRADQYDWPDYYVGSEQGFFNSGDTDEDLRQEDDDGPVGPEVQTTKWMDVQGEDFLRHCFFFNFDGEGTRRRVQVKMEDGSIRTFNPMTSDAHTAKAIYRLPVGTAQVRIYYTGRGSTASNPQFRRLGPESSGVSDPLKGYWIKKQFSVCRDVVFWPGAQYYFEIFTQVWGASGREYGFRFPSGGFSFMFDAGRLRKKWASTLFERTV